MLNECTDYNNTGKYKGTGIDENEHEDLSNIIRIFKIGLSLIEEKGLLQEYRQRVQVEIRK